MSDTDDQSTASNLSNSESNVLDDLQSEKNSDPILTKLNNANLDQTTVPKANSKASEPDGDSKTNPSAKDEKLSVQSATMSSEATVQEIKDLRKKFGQFNLVKVNNVPTLEHDNYRKWSLKLASELRTYKLWEIISRKWSDEAMKTEEFALLNDTVLDQIRDTISEYYGQLIENETSAAKAWHYLRDQIEGSELMQCIRIVRKIAAMIANRETDLELALIEFKNHVRDLRRLHPYIPENLLIGLLLTIVPEQSEQVVKQLMTIEANRAREGKTEQFKLEDAMQLFMTEMQLNKERQRETMKSLGAIGSHASAEKKECIYCGMKNHVLKDCRILLNDQKTGKFTGKIVVGQQRFGGESQHKKKKNYRQNKSNDSNGSTSSGTTNDQRPNAETTSNEASSSASSKPKKKGKIRVGSLASGHSRHRLSRRICYLDTGANRHCACTRRGLKKMVYRRTSPIYVANSDPVTVEGIGIYSFETSEGYTLELHDVQYAPDLNANYLSYRLLDKAGYEIRGKNGKISIYDEGELIAVGKLVEGEGKSELYEMQFVYDQTNELPAADQDENDNDPQAIHLNAISSGAASEKEIEWHRKLDHINARDLKKISGQLGIRVSVNKFECLTCRLGKMTKFPFPRRLKLSTKPLQVVHSDLSGIIRLPNPDGFRYFLVFKDDYTKYRTIFLLTRKYQVLEAFKQYVAEMERQTGCKVLHLKSDNGTEYINNAFDKYLSETGITRQLSVAGYPEQNSDAEREMRTLTTAARCLMIDANVGVKFWPRAMMTATYTQNRIPSSALGGKIPYSELTGKPVDYSRMRIWGSPAVCLDLKPNNKFAPRANPCIFTGYPTEHQAGYEVYLLNQKKVSHCERAALSEPGGADRVLAGARRRHTKMRQSEST